jgi:hypothetical protein
MKKEPGINGEWIPVSLEDRVSNATLPSIVSLGIPAAIQTQYAFSDGWGESGWILPVLLWVYGLLFWCVSTASQLLRPKRWEWSEAILEEKQRYWSAARIASRRFWGHWWVRFPIGLLFLSYGIHTLMSPDFTAQWISWIMLMCAFITPFVFIAEMALLPLSIVIVIGFLALVSLAPLSVIIMLGALGMLATLMLAVQGKPAKPVKKDKEAAKEDKAAAPEAAAATEVATEPAAPEITAETTVETAAEASATKPLELVAPADAAAKDGAPTTVQTPPVGEPTKPPTPAS